MLSRSLGDCANSIVRLISHCLLQPPLQYGRPTLMSEPLNSLDFGLVPIGPLAIQSMVFPGVFRFRQDEDMFALQVMNI